MATLDATTLAEYAAEVNATARAQVIVDALTSTVYGRVYDSEDNLMGEGTMSSPWATVSGDQVIPSTLNGFYVSTVGSVNAGWYFRFESGSRYVRLSFGLSGSGKEAEWSLSTWDLGTQAGIISGAINVTGNHAPEWTDAPVEITFSQGVGGTYDFSAVAADEDDDQLTYSLVGTAYTGISIAPLTGILTVTSAATAATRNLTVRVTDQDGLYADHAVSVVISVQTSDLKWTPGHYARCNEQGFMSKWLLRKRVWDTIPSVSNVLGGVITVHWGDIENAQGVYDWTSVDNDLDYLAAMGKKIILDFSYMRFGSTTVPSVPQSGDRYVPDYLISAGLVGSTTTGYAARLHVASCMDRFIALFQQAANRYDGHPSVEQIKLPETSASYPNDAQFTRANVRTQTYRALDAIRPMFSRTVVMFQNNFLYDQALTEETTIYAIGLGYGIGGPDCFTSLDGGEAWDARILMGQTWNGSAWVSGGTDYRGQVAACFEVQVIRNVGNTPALYYAKCAPGGSGYRSNHMVWMAYWTDPSVYNGSTLIPAMNWRNSVLPYIRDNSLPLTTAIPSRLL